MNNRKFFFYHFLALVSAMLMSCKHGEAGRVPENDDVKEAAEMREDSVPAIDDSADALTTEEVVRARALDIYSKVFSTYSDERKGSEGEKINPDSFLSEHLRLLIESCKTIQEVTGELVFDCDYWIDAQDYENLQLKDAKVLSCSDKQAEVEVRFTNFGEEYVVTLILVYDENLHDWFVNDFIGQNKRSLRHYLEHLL